MTDETHIVLEHLRHIRSVVDETQVDIRQLSLRVGVLERHAGTMQMSEAGQNDQIDRIKQRLDRIERRLDLAD